MKNFVSYELKAVLLFCKYDMVRFLGGRNFRVEKAKEYSDFVVNYKVNYKSEVLF